MVKPTHWEMTDIEETRRFLLLKVPKRGSRCHTTGGRGWGGAHRESWGSALRQKEREELWARAFTLVSIGRNK